MREIVAFRMQDYQAATTKPDKSNIITMVSQYSLTQAITRFSFLVQALSHSKHFRACQVVNQVRASGSFVRKDPSTGKWLFAEDLLCREKCSQSFRDCLHGSYRSSNMAKKKKRELEQQTAANAEAVYQAKRMRYLEPIPVAAVPISSHLFDWEMTPAQCTSPRVSRRVSGLTGPVVSALMDSFDDALLFEGGENPFEPTPIYPPTQPSMHQSLTVVKEDPTVVMFDPKALMSQNSHFRRRNSIFMSDDISAMSACEMRFDDTVQFQQYHDTRGEQECKNYSPKISAAFAA